MGVILRRVRQGSSRPRHCLAFRTKVTKVITKVETKAETKTSLTRTKVTTKAEVSKAETKTSLTRTKVTTKAEASTAVASITPRWRTVRLVKCRRRRLRAGSR